MYEYLIVTHSKNQAGQFEPNEYLVRFKTRALSIATLNEAKAHFAHITGKACVITNVVRLRRVPLTERLYYWLGRKAETPSALARKPDTVIDE